MLSRPLCRVKKIIATGVVIPERTAFHLPIGESAAGLCRMPRQSRIGGYSNNRYAGIYAGK
jgi:hypothetical protein